MNKQDLRTNYVGKIYHIMREHDDYNMNIQYILYKKIDNHDLMFKAVSYNRDNPDEIIGITNIEGYEQYRSIPEWDYNVDSYLFEDLSDGFKILYMPLDIHYGLWQYINEDRSGIECQSGLQRYLKYCKEEGINANIISHVLSHSIDDVMDLYRKENYEYQIIAETTCNNHAIVLGYKKDASSEYATWSTTINRKNGYILGHYFTKYKDAMDDYKDRCLDMMNKEVALAKKKCKPQRDNNIR